jgi:hypothetical protein
MHLARSALDAAPRCWASILAASSTAKWTSEPQSDSLSEPDHTVKPGDLPINVYRLLCLKVIGRDVDYSAVSAKDDPQSCVNRRAHELSRRHDNLTRKHHAEAMAVTPTHWGKWLKLVEKED